MSVRLSMPEFVRLADQVMAQLPAAFHDWLENLVIDVEVEPPKRSRDSRSGKAPMLLGIFHGAPVTEQSYGEYAPNRIVLYKRPLESLCRSRAEIAYEIRRTLLHELAHHFGYSEEDLERFESMPGPFDD